MVYLLRLTDDAGPADCRKEILSQAGNHKERKSMYKKILICAVIALVLVPAGVFAAGFGGNNTGAASGKGQYLQDGQTCMNQSAQQGTGTQEQYRHGMQKNDLNGGTGSRCAGDGQCSGDGLGTHEQNQTRSMLRLHDGTGGSCKNSL